MSADGYEREMQTEGRSMLRVEHVDGDLCRLKSTTPGCKKKEKKHLCAKDAHPSSAGRITLFIPLGIFVTFDDLRDGGRD